MRGGGRRAAERVRSFVVVDLFERQPTHDRIIAELLAQPVDGLFGVGGPPVEQIGMVGTVRHRQAGNADADETESRSVGLAAQQVLSGGEYVAASCVGWLSERARVRI